MNPKDSNVYRKAIGWLTCDSDGVARGDEHPFSINMQSHSGLVSHPECKSVISCLFRMPIRLSALT